MNGDRQLIAQIAAATRWAATTEQQRREATEAARTAADKKWERLADPDGVMTAADRIRAADHLKRAHMLRMARASVKSRAKKTPARKTA
jgi:hypothetical protein